MFSPDKSSENMKTKQEIAGNWLVRYTGFQLEQFSPYILLTNFNKYVDVFCDICGNPHAGYDYNMRAANGEGITIINFGMGSPNAALVMDLLTCIKPKACLFLGKCGGISTKTKLGDFILPLAAVRGEGTSGDYFPPEIPSLPAFVLERAVSTVLRDNSLDYWTGSVYTTNRRMWEHDEKFKAYLRETRAMAVDMECATLFSVGFYSHIPVGALLLVSDNPMIPEGVKTMKSDNMVTREYAQQHVLMGIKSLQEIIYDSNTLKHLKFDW